MNAWGTFVNPDQRLVTTGLDKYSFPRSTICTTWAVGSKLFDLIFHFPNYNFYGNFFKLFEKTQEFVPQVLKQVVNLSCFLSRLSFLDNVLMQQPSLQSQFKELEDLQKNMKSIKVKSLHS